MTLKKEELKDRESRKYQKKKEKGQSCMDEFPNSRETPLSIKFNGNYIFLCLFIFVCLLLSTSTKRNRKTRFRFITTPNPNTRKICLKVDQTWKARHKTCFLRPDTGPCRADIIQWYYDVRQSKCYRFFWGGCQGNGNKFESKEDCEKYCYLNRTFTHSQVPHFCSLAFDYGNCFGYFNRWTWDPLTKSCRRRLYSGCGGNQNNFQTRLECISTCLNPPNNTLERSHLFTTCIPLVINDIQ